jgi:hypothetical protein
MVADNSLTPEKQLLKLIEEQSAQANTPKPAAASPVAPPVLKKDSFSVGVFRARAGFFKQYFDRVIRSWSGPIDVKKVTAALTMLTAIAGAYFLMNTVILAWRLSALPQFSLKPAAEGAGTSLKAATQLKPLAFYLEKVNSRDLFQLGVTVSTAQTPQAEKKKQEEIAAFRSKYRIAGISWSDNPDAMVENTQTKKTSFVRRGQTIDAMKVIAIFKDKLVVNYEGAEFELF